MTAVGLTEQIKADVETADTAEAQNEQGTFLKGPSSVNAIAVGTDTEIDEDEIEVLNDGYAGSTSTIGSARAPSTNPSLQSFVSMGSVLGMTRKYKRETKLFALFLFATFTSALGSIMIYIINNLTSSTFIAILVLLCYVLIVAVCITMSIVYCVRFRGEKQFNIYLNEMIFGEHTPNEHDIFEMAERKYAGLWLYFSILYTSLFIIFRIIWYLAGNARAVFLATQSVNAMAVGAVLQVFSYSVTDRCAQSLDQQRSELVQRYNECGLEIIDSHIMDKLKSEMAHSQRFRPCTFITIFVITTALPFTLAPVLDWGLYSDGQYLIENDTINELRTETTGFSLISQIIAVPLALLDGLMWAFFVYFFSSILRHYTFPGRLMVFLDEELTKRPLPSTIEGLVQELMGWWELRSFYMRCIVQVYTWAISPLIAITMVAVIILFLVCFLLVTIDTFGHTDKWDAALVFVIGFGLIYFMLLIVQHAVSYHKRQLRHTVTIRLKLLEAQRNEIMGKYVTDETISRLYPDIIERMMDDMKLNYDAIRVFGIKVDVNFMILLKSGVSALVVGLGAALSRSYF